MIEERARISSQADWWSFSPVGGQSAKTGKGTAMSNVQNQHRVKENEETGKHLPNKGVRYISRNWS